MNIRERLSMAIIYFACLVMGFIIKEDIERIYKEERAKTEFGSHNKSYGK